MSSSDAAANSQKQEGILLPLKTSRPFTQLWLGQTLSMVGDNILFVVVPIVIYSMSGSPLSMGLFMTVVTIPQIVLLPFTGILVDRFSRIHLMILTDSIRFLLLAALTVFYVEFGINMPVLYTVGVIYGAMDALFQPAFSAARAEVFTPDIRNAANSLTQASQTGARLLGPTIGGFVMSFGSPAWGLGIDAATFLISIGSLLTLKLETPKTESHLHGLRRFTTEMLGGYRALRKHAWLWITILVFSLVNVAFGGIILVLLPWLIKVHLHMPAYAYGLVTSGEGIGALLAAWVFGRKKSWHHRGLVAYTGAIISAASLTSLAFIHWLPVIILVSGFSGAGIMVFGLVWEVSLQELVPTESFGRVVSLDMFGSISLMPVGYVALGWIAGVAGGTMTITGCGLAMFAILAAALAVPAIRRFQ
ncbi:MFS transporter [Alicyclobacillus sp. SO9]|uniref:MFS transporter n=1 Tax=Alicyclobacillus sp. SO9 TaxID=2665646 RepID=UPI0018E7AC18|nr:MFS transporter [Alicyclobacillus sp. SO9]QQE79072.1 MFS transporter [Alicyclobacillus sp. SO9]